MNFKRVFVLLCCVFLSCVFVLLCCVFLSCVFVLLCCVFLSCCAVCFCPVGIMFLFCWDVKIWELLSVNKMKPSKRVLVFHPTLVQGSTYKHNWAKRNCVLITHQCSLELSSASSHSSSFAVICYFWMFVLGLGVEKQSHGVSFCLEMSMLMFDSRESKVQMKSHMHCFPQTYEILNFTCVCL